MVGAVVDEGLSIHRLSTEAGVSPTTVTACIKGTLQANIQSAVALLWFLHARGTVDLSVIRTVEALPATIAEVTDDGHTAASIARACAVGDHVISGLLRGELRGNARSTVAVLRWLDTIGL